MDDFGLPFDEEGNIIFPKTERIIKEDERFKNEKAILFIKEELKHKAPKTCNIFLKASDNLKNPEKIESTFRQATGIFRHMAKLSIEKIDEKEFKVEVISGMYRCSWCNNFRENLEEVMGVPVFERGNCQEYIK